MFKNSKDQLDWFKIALPIVVFAFLGLLGLLWENNSSALADKADGPTTALKIKTLEKCVDNKVEKGELTQIMMLLNERNKNLSKQVLEQKEISSEVSKTLIKLNEQIIILNERSKGGD